METKVKTIARDSDCDLYCDQSGRLATVEGVDAYVQIINAKMRTSRGELQLATQKGVPYFQTVFANSSLIPIWENEVVTMLEKIPFVEEVSSFDCYTEGDVLKYTAEIKTDKGTVNVNGQ